MLYSFTQNCDAHPSPARADTETKKDYMRREILYIGIMDGECGAAKGLMIQSVGYCETHSMNTDIRMIDPLMLGIAAAIFIAAFTQAVTGFGSALVGMPLLTPMLGIALGAPLMALMSLPLNVILLVSQRRGFDVRAVWRIALAAVIAIPLGILGLGALSERVVVTTLGVILVGYGAYALIMPRLPTLAGSAWAYVFGFLSGLLTGAYNVGGPPLVIYAACREWQADEFRSNLQGLFLLMNVVVLASHALHGALNQNVLRYVPLALVGLIAGTGTGLVLDRFIPEKIFSKLVLVMLIGLGLHLIFG
jgi:hypothetical protein